jgi:CDP-6-deoxy-D-xylo-4-hexulose-3-dehydrase
LFVLPRQLDGLDAAWIGYPIQIRPDAGFARGDMQLALDEDGIDNRTIWSGNVTRQPMMRGVEYRTSPDGYPSADAVMEWGLLLSNNHAHSPEKMHRIHESVEKFLALRS